MLELEPLNKPRNCPRCSKLHLTEDLFCEHCLYFFLDDVTALATEKHAMWMR